MPGWIDRDSLIAAALGLAILAVWIGWIEWASPPPQFHGVLALESDLPLPVPPERETPRRPASVPGDDTPRTLPLRFVAQALLAAPPEKQRAMVLQISHHKIEQVMPVMRQFLVRPDLDLYAALEAVRWLKRHGYPGLAALLDLYPVLPPRIRETVLEVCAVYRQDADPKLIATRLVLEPADPLYDRWEELKLPLPQGSDLLIGSIRRGCGCH